jgi:mRNA interferase HigB
MRVRLVKGKTVEQYARRHANGRTHFEGWLEAIEYAHWAEPADILRTYRGNLLGGSSARMVFDLGGDGSNSFRIICGYKFGRKYVHLYVKWIGTHERYNHLTNEQKRTISEY